MVDVAPWVLIALGLIASAGFIAGNYILNRGWMLLVMCTAITAVGIQYMLMGLWAVAAVNGVLLVRNILLFVRPWSSRTVVWFGVGTAFVLATVVVCLDAVPTDLVGVLPLVAAAFNITALSMSRLTLLKLFLGLSSLAWVIFDIAVGNWQNLIGDSFGVLAATVALYRSYRLFAIAKKSTNVG